MISRRIPPFESYGTQVLFVEPTCNDLQDFETPLSFDTMDIPYIEFVASHRGWKNILIISPPTQATGAQLLSPFTAFCKSQKPKIFIFRY